VKEQFIKKPKNEFKDINDLISIIIYLKYDIDTEKETSDFKVYGNYTFTQILADLFIQASILKYLL
jgi:hypothetical protein